jgi:Asp-tRNA(Asn)/Glu-tRNA(Gln) amidotransferase C subunit
MDISDELVDKLADLAKLDFNGEEKEKIKRCCEYTS